MRELSVSVTLSDGAPPVSEERLRQLLAFAAKREQLAGEVSVWLCTDDEIADLHQRFMNIPGPTDVITFPGDLDGPEGPYLGDIAVSFDTAAEQGREAGHSVQRELAYLALHGLLHLAGYDDLDPESREEMIARQDALLTQFEQEYPGDWA